MLNNVFVISTKKANSFALCLEAAKYGEHVSLIYAGEKDDAVNAGKAYWLGSLDSTSFVTYIPEIVKLVKEHKPELVLIELTKNGRLAAAHAAVALETVVLTDVSELSAADGKVTGKRMVYGGSAVKTESVSGSAVVCLSVQADKEAQPTAAGEIIELAAENCGGITFTGKTERTVQTVNLNAATRVVGVGRGFSTEESLSIARDFAAAFEAEIGCTRPIAEEERWMPTERYIGVSGAMIKPAVYVAAGISGQVQHTVGVNEAGLIIAVNKDEHAPIFNNCDYGIIGDVAQVLPLLAEKLKA